MSYYLTQYLYFYKFIVFRNTWILPIRFCVSEIRESFKFIHYSTKKFAFSLLIIYKKKTIKKTHKAEIKVLDSLVVAVVSDFRNHLCCFSVSFLFYQCLVLNLRARIALHVRDVGWLGICIMAGSVLCFCTWNCGQWTQVLRWPFCSFFSVCCCHLRSLVRMIPRSRCLSVVGNCWSDML